MALDLLITLCYSDPARDVFHFIYSSFSAGRPGHFGAVSGPYCFFEIEKGPCGKAAGPF
jgi:hypothetical protein